ncbi:hypothetical protein [Geodermatophilus sp. SYSU D00710]
MAEEQWEHMALQAVDEAGDLPPEQWLYVHTADSHAEDVAKYFGPRDLLRVMNRYGAEGWHLVGTETYVRPGGRSEAVYWLRRRVS